MSNQKLSLYTRERKLLTSCPQVFCPLIFFALLQLSCPLGLPMSPWFGLGLHLDLFVWVTSLADFSAFLSQCFFPGLWHLLGAAPLPLMSSHTLPGPAHFHTLGEHQCKELPKRSLSSSVVSCMLLSSLSTSLPSFKTLLCWEASQKLVAAVLLSSQSLSYFPACSQLS